MQLCEFTQQGDKEIVLINPAHIVFVRNADPGSYIVTTALNSSGRNQFFIVEETLQQVRESVKVRAKAS